MKIVCVIDNLDSGGAQRQMCILSPLLKERGHDVEVLTYFPHDFFAPLLEEGGVPWQVIPWKNKLDRIFAVRKALREAKPDVVIAYLETPSLMAELATLPKRNFKLIVSERNTTLNPGFKDKIHYNFHHLADAVVPNSYSQQKVLEKEAPYLKNKIHTIMNCVDLDKYRPADKVIHNDPMDILVLGRFEPQKNALGLAEAAAIIREKRPDIQFVIRWYGRQAQGQNKELFKTLEEKIDRHSLRDYFILSEPVQNVIPLYHHADAVCMPSFYEGCSNVIAEAIACGKPVIAGNVCDNPILVKNEQNGLLFNPNDSGDMANVLIKYLKMTAEGRSMMGMESRKLAEEILSPDRCVGKYLDLIIKLTA